MSSPESPPPSPDAEEEPADGESALAGPASSQAAAPAQQPSLDADLAPNLDPADFYFDGPYLVFTAAYHLKRGACCHSGCRHCPYRESRAPSDPAPASNLEP